MAPHLHDKIDFTVEVFIVHKNKVLLRMHDKHHVWLSVGGHVELDEDPNQAALREVKEEAGLDITLWNGNQKFKSQNEKFKDLIPPIALNRNRISDIHEHVTFVYFATSDSDEVKATYEDDRSDDTRWFTKEELAGLDLLEDIRYYAENALDTLAHV